MTNTRLILLMASLTMVTACTDSQNASPVNVADSQPASTAGAGEDWAYYFGDSGGTKYSRLTQITRENVGELERVWSYEVPETGRTQTTPIIVDGTMYVVSAQQKVIALDAATGEEQWIFDSGVGTGAASRGLTWWTDGEQNKLFSAASTYIYAIDPSTGTAITSFGDNGRIDLRENLRGPAEDNLVNATSPAIAFEDLLITGGRTSETMPASPGDIRAYDVHTGEMRWAFHTVPKPGQPGAETWPENARETEGGANTWASPVVDQERGIVFVATGSPAGDFYGGERLGDNRFGNSVIALDARTGERLWDFQAVRHDVLDQDFPAPPVLLTVTRNGEKVDAVAAGNKMGYIFIFDRDTGEPLFDIVEQEVPASTVPGEVTSPTQPIPVLPAPTNRLTLSRDELTNRTPEMRAWAEAEFDSILGGDNPWTPLSVDQATFVVPGWRGGFEYGGITADADTGIIYGNVNNWVSLGTLVEADAYAQSGEGQRTYMAQCVGCHGAELQGSPPAFPSLVDVGQRLSGEELADIIKNGRGRMPGFPLLDDATVTNVISYITDGQDSVEPGGRMRSVSEDKYIFTGYASFYDPEGFPAWEPPYGLLHAIDMNTGEYLWTVPYGEFEELEEQGMTGTGAESHGGLVLTATGILFAGGTEKDRYIYAYDSANGDILWKGETPGYDKSTPAVYAVDGRQYVVTSTSPGPNDDPDARPAYTVFALPE